MCTSRDDHAAKKAVIAIDGGAASGKGTLSKTIASTFNLAHLVSSSTSFEIKNIPQIVLIWMTCLPRLSFIQDTGLLYRAVGFKALKSSIAFDDVDRLVRLSNSLSPEDLADPDLRGDEAAKAASQVSVRNG